MCSEMCISAMRGSFTHPPVSPICRTPLFPTSHRLSDALSSAGFAWNGKARQLRFSGVYSHGVFPGGVSPDGVSPDGVSPDGVSPDGVFPDGVSSSFESVVNVGSVIVAVQPASWRVHELPSAALAAAALLYMEALPTRDDDENGLHEPIHNGPIQNTSDHATCDHGTCDHGASDTESRTCSELPIQKELVASEAARGVAGGEAGGSPSDPPTDPPSSALSLTLRTDPLLEVLLSPPKNKKNASSLSLPKCWTPHVCHVSKIYFKKTKTHIVSLTLRTDSLLEVLLPLTPPP